MKKILFTILMSVLTLSSYAYDFEVNGFYYNIISGKTNEVEVTKYYDYESYSGSVTIPSTVTFNNTTYSVTSIGSHAFSGCSGMTSITIPNSVTSIGGSAFYGCSGLTSVTIPNSVTSIEFMAFSGCSGMTSITIPNSVTSIGNMAFSGCSGLTSVTIPNSVTSIESDAFISCSGLTSIKVEDGNTKYDSRNNCNAIIETATNTLIAGFKNTIIPNSVTSIGSYAFSGCSGLTSITIPNSVTSIGYVAFSGCSGLTSITIPNSVTSIVESAFYGCSGLKEVHISDIDKWAEIEFAGYYANPLYYANNLYLNGKLVTNAVLTKAKKIGSYAFRNCSGLTSVTIPNSVTSIGDEAFSSCSGLTSIEIPNSVTSIGSHAFWNCSGMTSITIPNSVTSIGSSAFECSGLTSIEIPNSVTSIEGHAFCNCSGLTSVTIPNSVTSIGDGAFFSCSSLTSIIIPNSITSIGEYAFRNCSGLTSITIPNSVTRIGGDAFNGCNSLTSVKVNWSRPLSIKSEVFYDVDKDKCILYVPKGTSMMYMSAPVWIDFKNIQEFSDEEDIHFISIKQDGGTIMQEVELGKVYEYKIVANEGWKINTVSFNGNDVTASLFNGLYSTPIIIGNSELNVVFKKISDVVKAVSSSDIKVFGYGNTISITGAEENANVLVYDYDGTLIANEKGNARIELYEGGVYIIKVDDETFKVRL